MKILCREELCADLGEAGISIYWYHLRRHWDFASLRLLEHLHLCALVPRSARGVVDNHLVADDNGHPQIRSDHTARRQRRGRRDIQHIFPTFKIRKAMKPRRVED